MNIHTIIQKYLEAANQRDAFRKSAMQANDYNKRYELRDIANRGAAEICKLEKKAAAQGIDRITLYKMVYNEQ